MEGSFADAANNHHFKRARWRRLWRQQIQDYLIAAIQNLRILLAHSKGKRSAAENIVLVNFERIEVRSGKGLWPPSDFTQRSAAIKAALLSFLRLKFSASPSLAFSLTIGTFASQSSF